MLLSVFVPLCLFQHPAKGPFLMRSRHIAKNIKHPLSNANRLCANDGTGEEVPIFAEVQYGFSKKDSVPWSFVMVFHTGDLNGVLSTEEIMARIV